MIQVRDFPEAIHRKLKARAADEGVSLSDFILKEIEQMAGRPSIKELAACIASRTPVKYKVSPAAIIREERGWR